MRVELKTRSPHSEIVYSLICSAAASDEELIDPADSTSKRLISPVPEPELNDDPLMNLWCMCRHKKPPAP